MGKVLEGGSGMPQAGQSRPSETLKLTVNPSEDEDVSHQVMRLVRTDLVQIHCDLKRPQGWDAVHAIHNFFNQVDHPDDRLWLMSVVQSSQSQIGSRDSI